MATLPTHPGSFDIDIHSSRPKVGVNSRCFGRYYPQHRPSAMLDQHLPLSSEVISFFSLYFSFTCSKLYSNSVSAAIHIIAFAHILPILPQHCLRFAHSLMDLRPSRYSCPVCHAILDNSLLVEHGIPSKVIEINNIQIAAGKENLYQLLMDFHLPVPYHCFYRFDEGNFYGLAWAFFGSAEEAALVVHSLSHFNFWGERLIIGFMPPSWGDNSSLRSQNMLSGPIFQPRAFLGTTRGACCDTEDSDRQQFQDLVTLLRAAKAYHPPPPVMLAQLRMCIYQMLSQKPARRYLKRRRLDPPRFQSDRHNLRTFLGQLQMKLLSYPTSAAYRLAYCLDRLADSTLYHARMMERSICDIDEDLADIDNIICFLLLSLRNPFPSKDLRLNAIPPSNGLPKSNSPFTYRVARFHHGISNSSSLSHMSTPGDVIMHDGSC